MDGPDPPSIPQLAKKRFIEEFRGRGGWGVSVEKAWHIRLAALLLPLFRGGGEQGRGGESRRSVVLASVLIQSHSVAMLLLNTAAEAMEVRKVIPLKEQWHAVVSGGRRLVPH